MKIVSIFWICLVIISAGTIEGGEEEEGEGSILLPKSKKKFGLLGRWLRRKSAARETEQKLLKELREINNDENLGRKSRKK